MAAYLLDRELIPIHEQMENAYTIGKELEESICAYLRVTGNRAARQSGF